MSTRRLNWTHRQRIRREDIRISVRREVTPPTYDCSIDLSHYDLPEAGRVFVEAYHQTTWMRFDHGTVGFLRAPEDRALLELGSPDDIKFRVKVLGSGPEEGRILAEADGIHPEEPEVAPHQRQPLLPTRGEDLGDELWRLDLEGSAEGPVLEINRSVADWRGLAHTPHFCWLVYPGLMRTILEFALMRDQPEESDQEDWRVRWIRFAERLPGMTPVPSEGRDEIERRSWIDEAVAAFCRSNRFRERFGPIVLEGSQV